MKQSRLWLAVYLTLIFISGALVGSIGYRLYSTEAEDNKREVFEPDEFRRRYTNFMKHSLELSEDQVQQLNIILDQTRMRFENLEKSIDPKREAIRKQQGEDIDAILNDEQRARLKELLKKIEENRKRSEDRPGPPRGHRRGPPPPSE